MLGSHRARPAAMSQEQLRAFLARVQDDEALRRQVLELVWESHTPLGAYELLGMLREAGRPAAPPTVYRALEFLLEQGLVHRLASRNAFVGCAHPGHDDPVQFLICQRCGNVAEMNDPAIAKAIASGAGARGFRPVRHTVEVTGTCPDCREAGG